MWARPLDYNKINRKLVSLIKSTRRLKQLVALYILLIQLRNGARISEAMEAYQRFVETGSREVAVRVRKSKKQKTRLVVVPDIVKPVKLRVSKRYVQYVCKKYLGCNTHSLRYAYITHLSKLNVPFQVISKITKHANPEMLQHYTLSIVALQLQRRIARK